MSFENRVDVMGVKRIVCCKLTSHILGINPGSS